MGHTVYSINVSFYFHHFPYIIDIGCDHTKRELWCYFSILANVSYDLFFKAVKLSQIFMGKVLKCLWPPEGSEDTLRQVLLPCIIASMQRPSTLLGVLSKQHRKL